MCGAGVKDSAFVPVNLTFGPSGKVLSLKIVIPLDPSPGIPSLLSPILI